MVHLSHAKMIGLFGIAVRATIVYAVLFEGITNNDKIEYAIMASSIVGIGGITKWILEPSIEEKKMRELAAERRFKSELELAKEVVASGVVY